LRFVLNLNGVIVDIDPLTQWWHEAIITGSQVRDNRHLVCFVNGILDGIVAHPIHKIHTGSVADAATVLLVALLVAVVIVVEHTIFAVGVKYFWAGLVWVRKTESWANTRDKILPLVDVIMAKFLDEIICIKHLYDYFFGACHQYINNG
jgi:hypothetical protein